MGKSSQKSKHSLKWSLIGLIAACWVLPLVMVTAVTGYLITNNINQQVESTVVSSTRSGANMCAERLDNAIESSRFASYDPTIKISFRNYRDTGVYYDLYREINAFMASKYQYDDKFLFTMLSFYDLPGDEYLQNLDYNTNNGNFDAISEYRHKDRDVIMELARDLDTSIGFYSRQGKLYMYRNVMDYFSRPIAVLVMRLDTSQLFDSVLNIPWGTGVTVWLNGTEVVLKGEAANLSELGIAFERNESVYQSGSSSMIYGQNSGNGYVFDYVIGVDSTSLMQNVSDFRYPFVIMAAALLPLLALVVRFFYANISLPIDALMQGSQKIETGDLGAQVPLCSRNREFQYLTEAFNEMSSQLKFQFDKIYREELALRDAKIKALQSQINPHFLNNTLEIINWEARLADDVKVSQMIESLSTMLDAAMDRKGRPMVHLSEEMMYVDAYLHIIRERLGKRLTVEKEFDEGLLDLFVPRLVMQPIIENAVEHGITPLQRGVIVLRAYRELDRLILEVENDGALTPEDQQKIAMLLSEEYDASTENAGNLGIHNVHQRLRIIYGKEAGLTIVKTDRETVLSKLVIPVEQSNQ